MAAAINQFETIESIRFFASLVGTEGTSQSVKDTANLYIERLLESLLPSINEMTAKSSGLTLIN